MKTFEEFYSDIVSEDLWFDNMKVQHGSVDRIREAAQLVFGEYIGNPKMFPTAENARSHIHYKLAKMPRKMVVCHQEERQPDFNLNPLDEEGKKRVDDLLNQFKEQLKGGFKSVPKVSPEEGELRKKLVTGYKFDQEKARKDLEEHDKQLLEYRYKTVRENHPELTPKEIYQLVKSMNHGA